MMKKLTLFFFLFSVPFAFADFEYLPEDYESWTALEKQQFTWDQQIVPTYWDELPPIEGGGWASILSNMRAAFDIDESFDHFSDEMPYRIKNGKRVYRPKLIHASGSVAKIAFVAAEETPYTGAFKGGLGLVRLSLAGNPEKIGYTPGMALKLFIDEAPSVNLQVMQKLDGQEENQNFFEHVFSNIIPKPEKFALKVVGTLFRLFRRHPRHLHLDHLSEMTVAGIEVEEAVAPYQIFFTPTDEVQIDPETEWDFRDELEAIEPGTHLYRVEATDNDDGTDIIHIGDIYTTSYMLSSYYGDKILHFKHQE